MISGDDVIRGKPDPECFEIGARVVAIRSTHQARELAGADAVIDDLRVMSF